MNALETIGTGGLVGAASYGALRLLHNALKQGDKAMAPDLDPTVTPDKLVITLPPKHKEEQHQKQADDFHLDIPTWAKIPLGAAAIGAGYMGAQQLHDNYLKSQATKDLDEKKKKYQEMLSTIENSKTASDTPIVDSFCEKIALELFSSNSPSSLFGNSKTDAIMNNIVYPAGAVLAVGGAVKFLADRMKRRREEDAELKTKLPQQIEVNQG